MRTLDIYTRVSNRPNEDSRSTEGQEFVCRQRVERVGAVVGEVFTDPGRSAWNPKVYRPGWEVMMARLESGQADGVVVYNLARFARRPADGERLITAAERGLAVLDSGSEYDLTSASGKHNFRENLNAAALYSDEVSEGARRGKLIKAMNGKVDHRRSFGFEPDGVTVRQREAEIIRDHARRLLAGETQEVLIAELNEHKVPSVRGAKWSYTTYRQIMTRPRNAGLIAHNGRIMEGVRLPGPQILDDDTYHRIVGLYAARRPGRQPSGRYTLTGLAICGLCDHPLAGRPVTGTNRRHYWCKHCRKISIDVRRLDDWAGTFAIRTLADPRHADAVARAERELETARAKLVAEIEAIEADALAIADRFGRGEMTLARYDAITGPLDKRVAKLRHELDGLVIEEPEIPAGLRRPPARTQRWLGLLADWDDGSPAERRAMVLRALRGKRLVVGPGRAAKFDPDRVTVR